MGALPRAQYGDVAALSMDVVDPNNSKSFFGTVYLNSGNISRITAEINKIIGDTDFFKLSPAAQSFYKNMGNAAAHIQMDTLIQQLKNRKDNSVLDA
jgi:hypothetical protein